MIEMVVSISVFILLIMTMWAFQRDISFLGTTLSDALTAQGEARKVLGIISSEIRTAAPSSTGAYAIAQAATSSVIFYSNIDSDSLKERVRYFLSGTTLKKGVIKPSGNPLSYNPANETVRDVVHDIANGTTPLFSYYDKNYSGTSDPLSDPVSIPAIRLIKATIIVDHYPTRAPGPATFTTQATMRNLKDNL